MKIRMALSGSNITLTLLFDYRFMLEFYVGVELLKLRTNKSLGARLHL